jgi:glycosyltransferase involved in cell wall biosynthesis
MKPLVSLIICTCNRPQTLGDTLKSILAQKLDGSFDLEVVVVDNSPDGKMKTALDPFQASFKGALKYFHEPTKGKSHALNCGVKNAKGEIVAFTDDDVIADEVWLSTMVGCLNKEGCDGVGGRVMPIFPQTTPSWIKDNPVKIAGGVVIYDLGEGEFCYDLKYDPFIGANFAFKKEVFQSCGLFRTDLGPGMPAMGEDTELVERLVEKGKVLYYCGKALIRHPVDLDRIGLAPTAKWHICLGRFAARREIEKKEKIAVYWFGVPRYIWKGIIADGCSCVFFAFDRLKFFNAWRAFFRKIGMIREYQDHQRSRQ